MKKTPMRTCVMCKTKTDKRQLLRIVRTPEGNVEFDPTGKKNGRGAYLCTKEDCINSVRNVKKIAATLEISPDPQQLEQAFNEMKNYLINKK
ncbi:MAG: RNase P modulator RnpM [Anaerofustis sp.]|jgi:predicted RNA-binding protein YlxR (DUF448 family)